MDKHAKDLHLELYTTDPLVRAIIKTIINDQTNQMKSAFRKTVS